MGWDSPVKETVDPRFINLSSRGGLGWLEGFNEFVCRCGLEWRGHPGTDKFINNVGDEATMELTLHGRVANLPASADKALIMGLVHEVFPDETFAEDVMKFCRHLAQQNGEQMGTAKLAIELAHDVGLAQARNVERLANCALLLNP